MSKRIKIALLVLIILLLVVGGVWLFLEQGNQLTEENEVETRDESAVFPFGTSSAATGSDFFGGESEDGQETSDEATTQSREQLWQITTGPVAGSGWIETDSTSTEVWYIESENGAVYSVSPETRETETITEEVSIPQVREVLVGPNGEKVVYRYLDEDQEVRTYLANIESNNSGGYSVSGSFLPNNITAVDLSPSGSKLFYLRTGGSRSVGIIRDLENSNTEPVFESPAREWRVSWDQPEEITIFTTPADNSSGFAYFLNSTTGELEKISEGEGLTALTNSGGGGVLQGQNTSSGYQTRALSLPEKTTQETIRTFTEKCEWWEGDVFFCGVPAGELGEITDWYQGRTDFVDNLYLFNIGSGASDNLFTAEQGDKASADITNIKIGPEFQHIIFTDKKTGALWSFRL